MDNQFTDLNKQDAMLVKVVTESNARIDAMVQNGIINEQTADVWRTASAQALINSEKKARRNIDYVQNVKIPEIMKIKDPLMRLAAAGFDYEEATRIVGEYRKKERAEHRAAARSARSGWFPSLRNG